MHGSSSTHHVVQLVTVLQLTVLHDLHSGMILVKIVKLSPVVYILLGKWGDKGQGFIKICANIYTNAGKNSLHSLIEVF